MTRLLQPQIYAASLSFSPYIALLARSKEEAIHSYPQMMMAGRQERERESCSVRKHFNSKSKFEYWILIQAKIQIFLLLVILRISWKSYLTNPKSRQTQKIQNTQQST